MSEVKDVVKAKHIELVDDDGKTRVSIGVDQDGNANMKFIDQNEQVRVSVGASNKGPASISLADNNGQTRVSTLVAENGSSYLFMYDRHGVTRIQVETGSADITTVILGGKDKKPLVKSAIESTEDNQEQGAVSLYDSKGKLLFKAPQNFN